MQHERSLIDQIVAQPHVRKAFIELARFYEAEGRDEDARMAYRGMLPLQVRIDFKLDLLGSKQPAEVADCQALLRMPAETVPLRPPVNDDPLRVSTLRQRQIECPGDYLDLLEHGTLIYDGRNRLYLSRDNTEITGHSTVNAYMLHSHALNPATPSQQLSGLTLLLAARNDHNFYHWHLELLTRLKLVESSGIALHQIDNLLVSGALQPWQKETLALLGVRPEQLKTLPNGISRIDCDQLLMPMIANSMGMASSPGHLEWLRSKFLVQQQIARQPRRKLAIYREQRGFTDHHGVMAELAKRGYEKFQPENHSYAEQVASFAAASDIVSTHGAALTLLTYCAPDTRVFEFYGAHMHPCFWAISSSLQHQYANVNCAGEVAEESAHTNKNLGHRLRQTVDVSAELLRRVLPEESVPFAMTG